MKKSLAAAVMMILLCGCSHKTEVRDKGFIRTIGCDSSTFQSVAIRLYGDENILTGNGETLFAAIENAETAQGKTLFTGHLELLVLNRSEIGDKLSVMIKNNRISPSCSLLISDDSAADTVLNSDECELSDSLQSLSRKGKISAKNIAAVLNDLLEEDSMAAVPIMHDGEITMGIIDKDTAVGILSEEESEGFCWITGSLHDIYIPVSVDNRKASFHVRKSSTRLTADTDGENIKITIEIKVNGNCLEEGIDSQKASKAAAEKISGLCAKTLSKTVTGMNADVLGIEKCIRSENIAKDLTWDEIIPKLQFYYNIKMAS